ncbi:hypothetical protein BDZ91DRAFT_754920 [Kalaharituber pfeilii]|nr:hypothetical protein BDZ91DRAFT_754920 [Kalaharituber pfeilii]
MYNARHYVWGNAKLQFNVCTVLTYVPAFVQNSLRPALDFPSLLMRFPELWKPHLYHQHPKKVGSAPA